MVARSRRYARTGLVSLAVTLGAALVGPGPASADPVLPDLSALGAGDSLSLSSIPGDAELAEALRTLKATGADAKLVEVLQTILEAQGSPDLSTLGLGNTAPGATPADPALPGTPAPAEPALPVEPNVAAATPVDNPISTAATGLEAFEKLTGAKLLTPAFAPFCGPTTQDNPLGLVTAPAVALPGPFPNVGGVSAANALKGHFDRLGLGVLGEWLDGNPDAKEIAEALTAEQTAFALVPPASHTNDRFQVAWFNTATMDGGMADLQSIDKISKSAALAKLVGHGPLRLARVDTGQGSILTAVFGTTTHAGRTCYFLPAVGIVDTPAK